ncbi:MAG: hypothetical protein J0L87_15260 [Bacteroidetes bacterium]|nr:hypothetical protein [Bacteroidota bacterium]
MRPIVKTLFWLTAFSIAMGFLETAVVVYLRKLYYPAGFDFPLVPVSNDIAVTEFFRELATIIMLVGVGIFAGRNGIQRFVFFLFSFAIWDIFYYIFLKILLDWPESLFTWDILFLIPVPWVGPVIAPCLLALSMIILTLLVVYFQEKGRYVHLSFMEILLLIMGSLTVILSFVWDYVMYLSKSDSGQQIWTLNSKAGMFEEVQQYVPETFNWPLFGIGQGIILLAIVVFYNRNKK